MTENLQEEQASKGERLGHALQFGLAIAKGLFANKDLEIEDQELAEDFIGSVLELTKEIRGLKDNISVLNKNLKTLNHNIQINTATIVETFYEDE